jgi:hypothetical protein
MEEVDYKIPKEDHAFIHEARSKREIILNDMIH